jgi:hypothetical protein
MIEKAVTSVGVLVSVVLIAASMAITAEFAYSRGMDEQQALIYASVAASADLFKSLTALFALWALQARQYGRAAAAIGFAILVTVLSLSSAIGLISESRSARAGERDLRNANLADVRRQRTDTEMELGRIKGHRSVTELNAAIDTVLLRPVATGQRVRGTVARVSSECRAVERATRDSCTELGILREELGRAAAGERLKEKIANLRIQEKDLTSSGAGQEADGQLRALAAMFRREVGEMSLALAVLMALVIEAGSSLGLFVATGHNLGPLRVATREEDREKQQPELGRSIAENTGPESDLPHTLTVEEFWMQRLFPALGQKTAFTDIFEDYRACCSEQGCEALKEQELEEAFTTICRQIGLKTERGFALGMRIGAGTDAVHAA